MPWLRFDIQLVTLAVVAVLAVAALAAAGIALWRAGGGRSRRTVQALRAELDHARSREGAGGSAGLALVAADLSHRLPAFVEVTREQLTAMSASPQVRAREWDTFTGSTLAGLAELESYAVRLKAMVILGHDNVAITLRSHDVVRIVEQSRAVAEGMIARLAEGVRLEISVRRRPAVAMCDRRVLSGVITSLLDNAARYAARTGASRVTVEVVGAAPNTGRQVVISVGDDGAKFTREDLDRLGGQGERGQAAAGTDGTGLTLWYLWQAVEQMNGEFAVRNRPEGEDGKVFEIRLPASQMPTDD